MRDCFAVDLYCIATAFAVPCARLFAASCVTSLSAPVGGLHVPPLTGAHVDCVLFGTRFFSQVDTLVSVAKHFMAVKQLFVVAAGPEPLIEHLVLFMQVPCNREHTLELHVLNNRCRNLPHARPLAPGIALLPPPRDVICLCNSFTYAILWDH